jgi:5-aminopentanamidase
VLRVSVIELPAAWGESGPALELVDRVLGEGPATDLALLPEMSLRGYVSPAIDFDLSRFAEPIDGGTALALAALAKKHATHLVGPLVLAEDDGRLFNATVGYAPDGSRFLLYKKRHPWIPEEWATAGPDPHPLFSVGGRKVTVACCYDVHFLVREARATLDDADLLLFPSAWVEEDDSRLRRLSAIARAHRIHVAAANWGPGVLHVKGQGSSAILDANGDIVARVEPGTLRADAVISP